MTETVINRFKMVQIDNEDGGVSTRFYGVKEFSELLLKVAPVVELGQVIHEPHIFENTLLDYHFLAGVAQILEDFSELRELHRVVRSDRILAYVSEDPGQGLYVMVHKSHYLPREVQARRQQCKRRHDDHQQQHEPFPGEQRRRVHAWPKYESPCCIGNGNGHGLVGREGANSTKHRRHTCPRGIDARAGPGRTAHRVTGNAKPHHHLLRGAAATPRGLSQLQVMGFEFQAPENAPYRGTGNTRVHIPSNLPLRICYRFRQIEVLISFAKQMELRTQRALLILRAVNERDTGLCERWCARRVRGY